MNFVPDWRNILSAAQNHKPKKLPLYEHIIDVSFMEKVLGKKFADLHNNNPSDLQEFFKLYCGFYRENGYDTVSYEVTVCSILPGGGALLGECQGAIQSRTDFEKYPWDELAEIFWKQAEPKFQMLNECMPEGMKAIGGIGNGIFEISEDLVGFENLCFLLADDPELFSDIYKKIGQLLTNIWAAFLKKFGSDYAVCRIGDDMGFKTGTLLAPQTLIEHVVPQYRKIISMIHSFNKPFLLHSCGNIFSIMDSLIAAGINAKHSNEDAIADYGKWIEMYGGKIGLFGGIDTDRLCRMGPDDLYKFVLEKGAEYRRKANGYALGSGNSIPVYVPVENYLAMVRAARELRDRGGE